MNMSNLINTKTIAAELGVSQSYVTSRLTKHPRFPAPKLRLSQKTVLWERDDFRAWREAEAIRAAKPTPGPAANARPPRCVD